MVSAGAIGSFLGKTFLGIAIKKSYDSLYQKLMGEPKEKQKFEEELSQAIAKALLKMSDEIDPQIGNDLLDPHFFENNQVQEELAKLLSPNPEEKPDIATIAEQYKHCFAMVTPNDPEKTVEQFLEYYEKELRTIPTLHTIFTVRTATEIKNKQLTKEDFTPSEEKIDYLYQDLLSKQRKDSAGIPQRNQPSEDYSKPSKLVAEDIQNKLSENNINTLGWPESFKSVFSNQQILDLFVSMKEEGKQDFETLHNALEQLWNRIIAGDKEIDKVISCMNKLIWKSLETHSNNIPKSMFDGYEKQLDRLEQMNFLKYSDDKRSVSFASMVLLDFATGRYFTNNGGLSDYIIDNQDHSFIRPILWSTLSYMRQSSSGDYQREIAALFKDFTDLRFHLQELLLNFLGYIKDPNELEKTLLAKFIQEDQFRRPILRSIEGNVSWFDFFYENYISQMMDGDIENNRDILPLLSSVVNFIPDQIMDMVKSKWLPDSTKDELTFSLLERVTAWDEDSVNIAKTIIERNPQFPPRTVYGFASYVSLYSPYLAPQLVATKLRMDIDRAVEKSRERAQSSEQVIDESLPEEIQDFEIMNRKENIISPIKTILENIDSYDLLGIAQAVPLEYVKQVFPEIIRIISFIKINKSYGIGKYLNIYQLDQSVATDQYAQKDIENHHPMIGATDFAMRGFAKESPKEFMTFVDEWKTNDLVATHRFLACGLEELCDSNPEFVADYLLEDSRRFLIGSALEDETLFSKRVIFKLIQNISTKQLRALEHYILKIHNFFSESTNQEKEFKKTQYRYAVQTSLNILSVFPENILLKRTKDRITNLTKRIHYKSHEELDAEMQSSLFRSPLSVEQMLNLPADDILKIAADVKDFDLRSLVGEIQSMVSSHPEKALQIITEASSSHHSEDYFLWIAMEVLTDVSRKELISKKDFFATIEECYAKGISFGNYRYAIARSIGDCATEGEGLPDFICEILQKWLSIPEEKEELSDTVEKEDPSTYLWRSFIDSSANSQKGQILFALLQGYLLRRPADYDLWLEMLLQHFPQIEESAWKDFVMNLRWLGRCSNHKNRQTLLSQIFDTYPPVLQGIKGVRFLVYCKDWIDPELYRDWLDTLFVSDWPGNKKACGELLSLLNITSPTRFPWVQDNIENYFGNTRNIENEKKEILSGIAYSAANLWRYPEYSVRATELLIKSARLPYQVISIPVMDAFRSNDFLPINQHTRNFLNALLDNPQVFRLGNASFCLMRLIDIFHYVPDIAYKICVACLDTCKDEMTDLTTSWAGDTNYLVDIAFMLKETGRSAEAMDIIEGLKKIRTWNSDDILVENDRHPVNKTIKPLRRRRRKRK